jgi:hypothetical protein
MSALSNFSVRRSPANQPAILERHPINVVGNALDEAVRTLCERRAGVNPVGWVPSVHPYLNSARVSVVPLLYGAGHQAEADSSPESRNADSLDQRRR